MKNTIRVFRAAGMDCTNGVSSRLDRLVLVDEESIDAPENAMIIGTTLGYRFLRPARPCPSGMIGYMDGGNLGKLWKSVSYSDAEVLPIHDRTETPEDYEFLSR